MSPVVGFIVPMKAIAAMKTRCWTLGIAIPVTTIKAAQTSSSVRKWSARRQEPDGQGGGGRTEQRRGRHQADLKRIESDFEQIGGQDDGGEAVAEAARRARRVKIDDIRLSGDAQAFE